MNGIIMMSVFNDIYVRDEPNKWNNKTLHVETWLRKPFSSAWAGVTIGQNQLYVPLPLVTPVPSTASCQHTSFCRWVGNWTGDLVLVETDPTEASRDELSSSI